MSYATMQDVLFALDVNDSELRDHVERQQKVPSAEPDFPEERGELRDAARPGAVAKGRRAA